MSILHIPVFHGIAPRLAPRKLTQAQSQIARNVDLFSQELKPVRSVIEVNTPTKVGTKQSIYKLGDLWLHWIEDVDVARSPLFLENDLRIHYTGHYNPKSTDDTLAQQSPNTDYPTDYYRLGIPQPDTAPTVGHTGGSGNDIERSYVYSFVSAWGEEGPPSPAGSHVGKADATQWDITTIDATPQNSWTGAEITSITFSGTTVTVTLAASEHHFFETTEYCVISTGFTGTGSLPTDIVGTWQVTRTGTNTFTFELPAAPTGTVTGFAGTISREAPLQLTGWTKRLYRTIGGTFRFVADGITGTTYTDTVADENLGEQLPGGLDSTKWWKAPNGNMKGMIAFPGGILCGFFGNTLAFSEPNVPNAWPESYRYTFNYEIVSIGVVGNTVVVGTKGFPSLVIGDDPASVVQSELELFQACVSKRGLASLVNGVMYPSPDGLVYVPAAGMPSLITSAFFKKKDWQLYNPSSFIADVYDDRYYAFYTNGGDLGTENGGIVFDVKEPGATFTTVTLSDTITAAHSQLEEDDLFLMRGSDIVQWDSGGSFLTYTWLSKLFTTPRPLSFTAAKIKLDLGEGFTAGEEAAAIAAAIASLEATLAATALNTATFGLQNNFVSGAIAGGSVGEYAVADGPYAAAVASIGAPLTALMSVYAWYDNGNGLCERHLVHTEELSGPCKFRLGNVDKGFLADQWEVEFNCTNVIIHEALLGTSMRELAKI